MPRHRLHLVIGCLLSSLVGAPTMAAGDGLGLVPPETAWPRWAARVQQGGTPAGLAGHAALTRNLQLMGDYFVDRPRLGDAGGLRVTSGLLVGRRSGMLDPRAVAAWRPAASPPPVQAIPPQAGTTLARDVATDGSTAWPYLGLGYSAASLRGGWGFSADLGLAATSPGNVRLGRVFSGQQNLDDAMRELRLRPVVQLGVSYAF